MEISVIGMSYRTAPVQVREQFSLPGELVGELLRTIRAEKILEEAVVLDTCNRTEVYGISRDQHDPLPHILEHVAQLKQTAPITDTSLFYRYRGMAAVAHLFRVAASLDSQIVGEHEILGQLRTAYRLALEARTAGVTMNRLFHRTFRVGKRVQTETDLGRGSASVAQTAVELAQHVFSSLTGRTVLLVGAGQTAELAAEALIRNGADHLVVANRTLENAERLARHLLDRQRPKADASFASCRPGGSDSERICPALRRIAPECSLDDPPSTPEPSRLHTRAISLDDIPSAIGDADLLISSTGSPEPVLTYEALREPLGRMARPLLIIDIAVPRDTEQRLGEFDDVFLYNIDDLNSLVAQNIERRRQEIPRAQGIVDHEVEQFRKWKDSLEVVPTIRNLQERLASLREAELKRHGRKFTDSDRQKVEKFAEGLCKKIFHRPITFLRELSANNSSGEVLVAVDLIRRMFDLDSAEQGR